MWGRPQLPERGTEQSAADPVNLSLNTMDLSREGLVPGLFVLWNAEDRDDPNQEGQNGSDVVAPPPSNATHKNATQNQAQTEA